MTARRVLTIVLCAAAALPEVLSALSATTQPSLVSGSVVERTLRPDEISAFTLTLDAGEFVRIDAVRRDADIAIYVRTPDGVRMGAAGLPRIALSAAATGVYRIEIEGPPARRQPVRYAIRLAERRRSSADDRLRAAAQARLAEGLAVNRGSVADLQRALAAYDEAIVLSRKSHDRSGECDALLLRAAALFRSGDITGALAAAGEARRTAHDAGERWLEAEALAHMTRAHFDQRRLDEAIDAARQSMALYRAVGDRKGEHVVLQNLALVYGVLGEYQTTIDILQRVLAFARRIGEKEGEAYTLSGLGRAMLDLGNFPKALELEQQAVATARSAGLRATAAIFLNNLGLAQEALGRQRDAMTTFHALFDFAREAGSRAYEARARHSIGAVHLHEGDRAAAREWIESSLPGFRAAGDTSGEAQALADLARVDREDGALPAARAHIEQALDLYEATRGRIPTEEFRAAFLASRLRNYELAIEVLAELHRRDPSAGYAAAALAMSERARARSLLDMLARGRRDLDADAAPALKEHQARAEGAMKAAAVHQMSVMARTHTPDEAARAQAEVDRLAREVREARAATRASSERLSAITSESSLAEMQQTLIDDDMALVEYFLGDTRSFVWVVTRSAVRLVDLPARGAIEPIARRAYAELSSVSPAGNEGRRTLAQMVLGPIEADLPAHLLVVADGILQYIPLGALPLAGGNPAATRHTVVYLPSASTLAAIRRAHPGRPAASLTAAVLADPVYTREDPRVTGGRGRSAPASGNVTLAERSAKQMGVLAFDRLYGSRREATAIARLAGTSMLQALDFRASRQTAVGAQVADARIVHFATHGLLNTQHPELSGLVLSLVDRQGRPQNGFLAADDIFDLHLRADLVVLSACETALGAEIRGEGLVGLTRAFFFAGAEAVVASLWRVPDAATAALMDGFYRRLLVERMTPAAALRESQLALRRTSQWRQPYFWAGFVLQGEPH